MGRLRKPADVLEDAIYVGRGGIYLKLTPEQYCKLRNLAASLRMMESWTVPWRKKTACKTLRWLRESSFGIASAGSV
jgi:hypothetical protein